MTWFIINHLTRPIQQIIAAVAPYQKGIQTPIPEIKLDSINPSDDFGRLADTLNSLYFHASKTTSTILTFERNEKKSLLESLTEGVVADRPLHDHRLCQQFGLKMLDLGKKSLSDTISPRRAKKVTIFFIECQSKTEKLLNRNLEIKKREKNLSSTYRYPQKRE